MPETDLPGFARHSVTANGIALSLLRGGAGVPVILLHGYPQNALCWRHIAPRLAEDHDVIVPDLRGYGQSEAPPDDAGHTAYSKREMARDLAGLMDALGLDRATIIGHDRGARVAYRFALDHPGRLDRLGILEIVPTADFWAAWTAELALKAYHWTFLAQPAPLPERMIAGDPAGYLDWTLASWTATRGLGPFEGPALESYRAQMADPARCAAMCADYRAGATTDRQIDEADRAAGRRIGAPLHYIWAEGGFPAQTGDPLGLWRGWARDVTGTPVAGCGHFMMEEAPEAVLAALRPLLE